jgi:hypothetical protein
MTAVKCRDCELKVLSEMRIAAVELEPMFKPYAISFAVLIAPLLHSLYLMLLMAIHDSRNALTKRRPSFFVCAMFRYRCLPGYLGIIDFVQDND